MGRKTHENRKKENIKDDLISKNFQKGEKVEINQTFNT